MDKISSFKINKLTMSGFSCFKNEISFDMDFVTFISGGNHVGKSSIANAVAFAVTGHTFEGEQRAIDKFYNEEIPEIEITLELIDSKENIHHLIRKRKKDKMSISFNGYSISQSKLNEIFGERDLFLSLLNPYYLIEVLRDDGKKLFEQYLPTISHESVLEQLTEYNRTLLNDENLLAPEDYISTKREEGKNLENDIKAYQSQKLILGQQRKSNANKLSILKNSINELLENIKNLKDKKVDGIDEQEVQNHHTALSAELNKIYLQKPILDTLEIERQIQSLMIEINNEKAKEYVSQYNVELAKFRAEVDVMIQNKKKLTYTFENLQTGVTCPQCMRIIDEHSIDIVKGGFSKKLDKINTSGKNLSEQYKELKNLDDASKKVFLQLQLEDITKKQTELHDFQSRHAKILHEYEVAKVLFDVQLENLNNQLQSKRMEITMGHLCAEEVEQLNNYETQKVNQIAEYNAIKELYKGNHIDEYDKKIAKAQENVKTLNQLVYAAIEYASKRSDMLFSKFDTNNVKIVLMKVLKTTGEIKHTFDFTYKGRDYRRLSRSQKLIAGIEVAELLKKLTGRNYPMFIDDAESFEHIPKPTGQILISSVKKKRPLTVVPSSTTPPFEKAS